jgi:O-antigen ligase
MLVLWHGGTGGDAGRADGGRADHAGGLFARVEEVLALHDPSRGFGSGFTGRTAEWLEGLRGIAERPFFGYGFRRQMVPTHSGYLFLMEDVGIPLATAFIMFIIVEIVRHARESLTATPRCRPDAERETSLLISRISASYLACELAIWIFEPAYLTLGEAHTVLLLVFLAAPHQPCARRGRTVG